MDEIILKYLDREYKILKYESYSYFPPIHGHSIKCINTNEFVSLMHLVRDINNIFCTKYASNEQLIIIWIQDTIKKNKEKNEVTE